jgi:hypothetical protein
VAQQRRAIHAYLSDESHQTWHDLAERSGVSVSGILEALAREFGDNPPDQGGYRRWDDVIRRARGIDVERRRRNRT